MTDMEILIFGVLILAGIASAYGSVIAELIDIKKRLDRLEGKQDA